jgi:hypothetical protein
LLRWAKLYGQVPESAIIANQMHVDEEVVYGILGIFQLPASRNLTMTELEVYSGDSVGLLLSIDFITYCDLVYRQRYFIMIF